MCQLYWVIMDQRSWLGVTFYVSPLHKPMQIICQVDPQEHDSVKFRSKYTIFQTRKCTWICGLRKWHPFFSHPWCVNINKTVLILQNLWTYINSGATCIKPNPRYNSKCEYRQTSNIKCILVGNKIVDHSDVLGALSVGAAPTTSSFST